jgi:hypothetical protein
VLEGPNRDTATVRLDREYRLLPSGGQVK